MKSVFIEPLNPSETQNLPWYKPHESSRIAFKGFEPDLSCIGFQYEIGKYYEYDSKDVKVSNFGFHSCPKPLDVFLFYPPSRARYFIVETSAYKSTCKTGRQQASSSIVLKQELPLSEFFETGISATIESIETAHIHAEATIYSAVSQTRDCSASTHSGHCSIAANAGDYSIASSSGNRSVSAITGDQSVAMSVGDFAVSPNTGNRSISKTSGSSSISASTGHKSVAIATEDFSVSCNVGKSSFSGCYGDFSVAVSCGVKSASCAESENSIALATGLKCRAKAQKGSAIIIAHRGENNELINIRSGIAGKDIKEDVWYTLDANGDFVEELA